MIDTQNQPDYRKIPINKVGIKGLKYPVKVLDKTRGTQSTVADISMYVDLPHQCKGTHMSRFVEILHQSRTRISLESLTTILADMKKILGAQSSHIEITFPYFIAKQSPSAGVSGLMDYTCSIIGSSNSGHPTDIILKVAVPVTSVCPCSKAISDCGAHNQRGEVLVSTRFKKLPQVRGRPGPGCGQNPVVRPQHHLVFRERGKLRVHPQPQRLRLYRKIMGDPGAPAVTS